MTSGASVRHVPRFFLAKLHHDDIRLYGLDGRPPGVCNNGNFSVRQAVLISIALSTSTAVTSSTDWLPSWIASQMRPVAAQQEDWSFHHEYMADVGLVETPGDGGGHLAGPLDPDDELIKRFLSHFKNPFPW